MITKTEKYRSKIDTPWIKKGELATERIIEWKKVPGKPKMSDFPDLFTPVYKLEDSTEVCLNDLVWREKNGIVKQVQFNATHIGNNSKVFGTSEACEKWLESSAKKAQQVMLKENRDSSFQTLKSWSKKLDDLEGLSYKELGYIRDGIQTCIKNMEQI